MNSMQKLTQKSVNQKILSSCEFKEFGGGDWIKQLKEACQKKHPKNQRQVPNNESGLLRDSLVSMLNEVMNELESFALLFNMGNEKPLSFSVTEPKFERQSSGSVYRGRLSYQNCALEISCSENRIDYILIADFDLAKASRPNSSSPIFSLTARVRNAKVAWSFTNSRAKSISDLNREAFIKLVAKLINNEALTQAAPLTLQTDSNEPCSEATPATEAIDAQESQPTENYPVTLASATTKGNSRLKGKIARATSSSSLRQLVDADFNEQNRKTEQSPTELPENEPDSWQKNRISEARFSATQRHSDISSLLESLQEIAEKSQASAQSEIAISTPTEEERQGDSTTRSTSKRAGYSGQARESSLKTLENLILCSIKKHVRIAKQQISNREFQNSLETTKKISAEYELLNEVESLQILNLGALVLPANAAETGPNEETHSSILVLSTRIINVLTQDARSALSTRNFELAQSLASKAKRLQICRNQLR